VIARNHRPPGSRPPARQAPGCAARRRSAGWIATAVLALACASVGPTGVQPARAQGQAEYEIKAAFVYNFAKFVQWPASSFAQPQAPLVLCLVGRDVFGPALETIDHKLVQGHALQIRRQVRLDELGSCHILFVADSERQRLGSILRAVPEVGVLTISDIERFAEAGGIIGFYNLDNKVQFSINLDQARSASLQINSQLLRLARVIRRDAREDRQ
jgi:hypothetical protein